MLALAACFFCSGVGSLILELVWTRELRLVFGSTTLAVSTVLVAYMLGLGIGGLGGGRLATGGRTGVRAYGVMELAIGFYALAVPSLLGLFPIASYLWLSALPFWPAALLRFAMALVVLVLPTVLMGATLPVLVRALVERSRIAGGTGLLYGLNTLGAVTGVLLATFVLFPGLGLVGTNRIAAALDVLVGLIALLVLARRASPSGPIDDGAAAPAVAGGGWHALLAYGLVGGTAMIFEVAWTRALSLVLGSSIYAFTAMLAAFLSGIALGSLGARRLCDRLERPAVVYAGLIATLGVLALVTTALVPHLPDLFVAYTARFGLGPGHMVALQIGLAMLAMLPPTLVLGALFPLLVRLLAADAASTGSAAGRAYFANTMGSTCGAFAAGFLLIPGLGLRSTLALASALDLVAAGLLLLSARRAGALVPLAATVLVLLRPPGWDNAALVRGVFRHPEQYVDVGLTLLPIEGVPENEIVYYRDGLNTTVSVHRYGEGLELRVNGKTDASTGLDMPTQVLLAEVPLLFGAPARDVLVIGYASGITAGALLRHPIERLDAVEIEPAIVEASRLFDAWNGKPLADPRLHMIVDDGRTYLLGTHASYDVIVSEPSNPWMSGVSNLFTREFFHAARSRLRPDGRLMQWIELYGMEPAAVRSILAALRAEFPYVYGFADRRNGSDLLLLATLRPLGRADLPQWESLPQTVQLNLQSIGNFSSSDLWSLVRLLPADVEALAHEAPVVNTDDNLFVELRTPFTVNIDAVRANWQLFGRATDGIVPLLEATAVPLDAHLLGALAAAYAVGRRDDVTAARLLSRSEKQGSSGLALFTKVVLERTADAKLSPADQLPTLDRAVDLAPTAFEPLLLRAHVHGEAGDWAAALVDIDAAQRARPDDPRGATKRWRILHELGRDDEADAELSAILAHPYMRLQVTLWRDAAQSYLQRGRMDAGIAALSRFLMIGDPQSATGWTQLAEAYRRTGQAAEGARAERNAEHARKNGVLRLHRDARLAERGGARADAKALLEAALRLDPSYQPAREDLAHIAASGK